VSVHRPIEVKSPGVSTRGIFTIHDNGISLNDKVATAYYRKYDYEELLAALLTT